MEQTKIYKLWKYWFERKPEKLCKTGKFYKKGNSYFLKKLYKTVYSIAADKTSLKIFFEEKD